MTRARLHRAQGAKDRLRDISGWGQVKSEIITTRAGPQIVASRLAVRGPLWANNRTASRPRFEPQFALNGLAA
jgi:hypothetical protein